MRQLCLNRKATKGMTEQKHTLVIGGARSGKSRFAEQLCHDSGLEKVYLATAQVFDDEMKDRVARHKVDRGDGWLTVEEPLALVEMLEAHARQNRIVLVDCMTLWLTNLMMADWDILAERERLVDTLTDLSGPCVFVTNEVGQGIVPENKLARAFRDEAGWLNQSLATHCSRVVQVTAGLPLVLKERS